MDGGVEGRPRVASINELLSLTTTIAQESIAVNFVAVRIADSGPAGRPEANEGEATKPIINALPLVANSSVEGYASSLAGSQSRGQMPDRRTDPYLTKDRETRRCSALRSDCYGRPKWAASLDNPPKGGIIAATGGGVISTHPDPASSAARCCG